jgi:hypothetical protein
MDYLSDNDIDSMFDTPGQQEQTQGTAIVPMPQPVPLFPLAMAAQPAPNGQPGAQPGQPPGVMGFVRQQWGPMPAWAWLLLGGSVAGAGYLFYQNRSKPKANESDSSSSSRPSIGEVVANAIAPSSGGSGKWAPSRSRFAESLERYFQKKGMSDQLTVWHDADDAKKKGKMAFVSPLINVEVKQGGAVKVDAALTRFCRREGLDPKQHQDGNIGLYPHSTKRGKEWEEYIDALRDEGQSV